MTLASIVVLCYNGYSQTTGPCLSSIVDNTEGEYELIVVDNASTDETQASLKKFASQHQHVRLRINDTNKGFAGGNNDGMTMAKGKFIILLNNDTLVPTGWLNRLLRRFDDHQDIGMIGPVTNSAGNEQCIALDNLAEHNFEEISGKYIEKQEGSWFSTDKLGFFCVAIRKTVIDHIGLLDEGFGIGMFEDDDYCLRAKNAGYVLAVVDDCFVYHKGSVSFKKLSTAEYQETFNRNRLYYLKKHGTSWLYTDIANHIWQKIRNEIELQETACDQNALERIHCRLANMTSSLYQLKTVEENQAISNDAAFAKIKSDENQKQLMEISDWATGLKKENDQLSDNNNQLIHENGQLKQEIQNFKESIWYKIYRFRRGNLRQS